MGPPGEAGPAGDAGVQPWRTLWRGRVDAPLWNCATVYLDPPPVDRDFTRVSVLHNGAEAGTASIGAAGALVVCNHGSPEGEVAVVVEEHVP